MSSAIAGDGHSNIHKKDSLANPTYLEKIKYDDKGNIERDAEGNIKYLSEYKGIYDVVLANMPYSQKTKHGRLYDLPSSNGDSICVQHCIKAINSTAPNGRMALVVPEGFLFRKDLAKTREYLLNHCELQSVISLPQGVFLPYTGVKTDIIYATKVNQKIKPSEKKKDFWYFDVKSDGYTLDNHRRKLVTPSALSKYEEYRKLDKDQTADMMKVGFEVIPLEKVRQNANILVGSRYREHPVVNSKYDVVKLEDIVSIANGFAFPLALQGLAGNIPFYKVSDMNSTGNEVEMHKSNNYVSVDMIQSQKWKTAPEGTIIFPKIGAAISTNKKRMLTEESLFDNNIMGLICSDRILPKYLWYILNSIDITKWASRANPPSIAKDSVLNQQIPLPPIDIQAGVVSEFDGYQRIVSGAQQVIRSYIPKVDVSSDSLERLGDIFDPVSDNIDPATKSGTVYYVGLENIVSGTGEYTGDIESRYETIKSTKRVFKNGDILFGKLRPALNKVAFATFDGICSTDIIVLRVKRDGILPEYYSALLRGTKFNKLVLNGVSGGQLPRVDLNYLLDLPVQIVPVDEQQRVIASLHTEREMMDLEKTIIDTFSGKIDRKIKDIWGE